MELSKPLTDGFLLPHRAFEVGLGRVERTFQFSLLKSGSEGLGMFGESRTGKSSLLHTVHQNHPPSRDSNGWSIPVLLASVPSLPTTKSLAGVILEALHASDPDRGTENERTRRIRILMKETGTRMIMIDEFQHFYDRSSNKVMHHVADWLKGLIDSTQATLIIAGLPTALGVIEQNEQLMGRFTNPIRLRRFDWAAYEDRMEFIDILASFHHKLSERYTVPDLGTEQMAFKFWLATGGLIGYVAKLLKHAERNAIFASKHTITLEDLHQAHLESVWVAQRYPDLPQPFRHPLNPAMTADLMQQADRIGKTVDLPAAPARRGGSRKKTPSLDQILVSR